MRRGSDPIPAVPSTRPGLLALDNRMPDLVRSSSVFSPGRQQFICKQVFRSFATPLAGHNEVQPGLNRTRAPNSRSSLDPSEKDSILLWHDYHNVFTLSDLFELQLLSQILSTG